jgi:hypothetical protein
MVQFMHQDGTGDAISLRLYNAAGALIKVISAYQVNGNSYTMTIGLQEVSPGMYYGVLNNGGNFETFKFIKDN